ncbi:DUF4198 domain-containing protein [Termitidicoccus mucosus]|uniref:Nickel transport complex protein, NikM subunit, transmembrane n=1 Tax=Termitidicoccus mucosus TaxID=1184151 RepID=A0A178ICT7_9BACT|nr:hypothetical protein AW736_20665 [Opitutaceae bacterium TSB47]
MKHHAQASVRPRHFKLALAAILFAAAPVAALAHSVWIEDMAGSALVARFGDLGGPVEKSPGYLDYLALPSAWVFDAEGKPSSFEVAKNADHFLFKSAAAAQPLLAETAFPVRGRPGQPGVKPLFYLRWQPPGAPVPPAPALTLDLLPAAGSPGDYIVWFRGKPLAGAKVVRHGLGEKEETFTADEAGRVKIPALPGVNLLTVSHREELAGFDGGRAYAGLGHNASLSWRQP